MVMMNKDKYLIKKYGKDWKEKKEKFQEKAKINSINHSLHKSKKLVSKPSHYRNITLKTLNTKMSGIWGKDNNFRLEINFPPYPKRDKSMFDIFKSERIIYSKPRFLHCTFLGYTGMIKAYENPEDFLTQHGDPVGHIITEKDKDRFFFTLELFSEYDHIDESMETRTIVESDTICFDVTFYRESETLEESWNGYSYAKNDFLKIIVTGKNELINETKELYLTRQ